MSTFVYEGREGGQKSPKNRPRGLCMTPYNNNLLKRFLIRCKFLNEISLKSKSEMPCIFLFESVLAVLQCSKGPDRLAPMDLAVNASRRRNCLETNNNI